MASEEMFKLEENIMGCWSVIEDLNVLYHASDGADIDQIQNALLGIMQIYSWKFDNLFRTFEHILKSNHEKRDNNGSV